MPWSLVSSRWSSCMRRTTRAPCPCSVPGMSSTGPARPWWTAWGSSANSLWHWEVEVRYRVTEVRRLGDAIAEAKYRHGWRVQVTDLPKQRFSLQGCVLIYNRGWSLERDFHVLKDVPLGIRPLCVR